MNTVTVSAPGKVHVLGEHVVVHGKPALIVTVGLRCRVTIRSGKDDLITITSKQLHQTIQISCKQVTEKTETARSLWEAFTKNNDVTVLKSILTSPLDYAEIIIGETLKFYKLAPSDKGFTIKIDSEIPIGGSIGSSAALAVAMAGALTLFFEKPFEKTVINEIAFISEQRKHGFPSGGDNAASCFGGLVWYRKEAPELKIIQPVPFTIPEQLSKNFLLIDTGKPKESTGEMVSSVKTLLGKEPETVQKIFDNQEVLTRNLLGAVKRADEAGFMSLIRQGQRNLEKLGVCSPVVSKLITRIEKAGGVAKICGGGGRTKGTGVVLAYHPHSQKVRNIADEHRLPSFQIALGVSGLTIEKEVL